MADPSKIVVYTKKEFREYLSPMVYILSKNNEVVFVGGSRYGCSGFKQGKVGENLDWDEIRVIRCELDELKSLFLQIEKELNPSHKNRTKSAGLTYETEDERRERIEEKREREKVHEEAVESLMENLPDVWKLRR